MGTFKGGIALNPITNTLVASSSLEVFAEADTNLATPLTVTLVRDGSSVASIPTSLFGAFEDFVATGESIVFIKSGSFVTTLISVESIRDDANAAKVAAEAAQVAAEAAADAAGGGVPAGGSTGQVVTKLSGTEGDAGWVTPTAAGTTSGTFAAGDDSRIVGAAQKASNLSDLASVVTARTNLGLQSNLDYRIRWVSGAWEESRPGTLPTGYARAVFDSPNDAAATDPYTTAGAVTGDLWLWAAGGGPA